MCPSVWVCDHELRVCEHDTVQITKREFNWIYNFSALGDKDELFGFLGQKVKGQGHSNTKGG